MVAKHTNMFAIVTVDSDGRSTARYSYEAVKEMPEEYQGWMERDSYELRIDRSWTPAQVEGVDCDISEWPGNLKHQIGLAAVGMNITGEKIRCTQYNDTSPFSPIFVLSIME